jgi:RNA polymerase sigma-70 factor (ECF subfamily)
MDPRSVTPECRPAPINELAVLAVNEKNRSAFAVIYERYKEPMVKRLLCLVNNKQTAEDFANDTFCRVWELIQQERITQEIIDHFVQWLYRIAINRAIDYLRRAKRLTFVSILEGEQIDPEEYALSLHPQLSVPGHEEWVCEWLFLGEAIAAMSPQYRICYLLRVHYDYTNSEIAEILGISEKAVSANVTRGNQQLHMICTRMLSDQDMTKMLSDQDMTKGGRKRYGKTKLQAL